MWRGTTRLDCSPLHDNNSTHYYWFLISFIILNSSRIGRNIDWIAMYHYLFIAVIFRASTSL